MVTCALVGSQHLKLPRLLFTTACLFAGGLYALSPTVRTTLHQAVSVLAEADLNAVRNYIRSFGIWAPAVSALLMLLQSIIAPLPSFVLTLANGFLFGPLWGFLLSWSSSLVAAMICFTISRGLGRTWVERWASPQALTLIDDFFARYGPWTVLIARLLPFISFDLVSYAAGLTATSVRGFTFATAVGMLPATLLYTYLGHRATGSIRLIFLTLSLLLALAALLAAFKPRLTRWVAVRKSPSDRD